MASARPLRRTRPVRAGRARPETQRFTEAASLYGIPHWGKGFFHVSEDGHLVVRPTREPSRGVALKHIVDEVARRGISTPMVIRFPQILSASVANLNDAFARAIDEYGYGNQFRGVFPIKVNQKRVVVDHIVEAGRRYGYGLEAGSKPELLAAIAADLAPESIITCNGYKDDTFIRMALNAVRMKKKVILILEKVSELERILEVARTRGVRPLIGMRAKLYARGSGKWAKSGGEAAKFGLTTPEMLEAVKILKSKKMLDCLVMLHFHIGSQITDIRKIKEAIREAGRVYAKLRGLGVPIQYLNLGGGLGVDYDGSKTAFDSSMNYSVQEYANDVVYTIQQICEEEKVPPPTLVTESGRAVTAYHSVFVTNVLDVADRIEQGRRVHIAASDPNVLKELASIYDTVNAKTLRESYHDALQYKEEVFTLFNLGHLSLEDRSKGEVLFWQICEKIHRDLKTLKEIPEEFEDMEAMLADKYVLNFSVFQSLPDIWAIDQLFPILPIHRLNEKPGELGTLADITCDSDGKIEKFIDLRDIKEALPLHALRNGEPYYIGVCLMGAYQDVLGDLHNLFGEAHEVLVTVDEQGRPKIEDVLPGESCERVLEYMNYDRTEILDSIDKQLQRVAGRSLKKDEVAGDLPRVRGRLPESTRTWRDDGPSASDGARGDPRRVLASVARAATPAPTPAPVELQVGVYQAPPFVDEETERRVVRPHRGPLERARRGHEHALSPRRGRSRRDPRRHRQWPLRHVRRTLRRDARARARGRLHARLHVVGSLHRRSPDAAGGPLARGRRGSVDAHGAAALRRRRRPRASGRNRDVAAGAAAERDVRGAAGPGHRLGHLVGRRDDGRRGVRRQGADHVLGTSRRAVLDVREPRPRHRADRVHGRQARRRRVRPGPGTGEPPQRARRNGRGLRRHEPPAARGDHGACLPRRGRRESKAFSPARSTRSCTAPTCCATTRTASSGATSRFCRERWKS